MTAKARDAKAWEMFEIQERSGDEILIKSLVGKQHFLSAEGGGGGLLRFNKSQPKGWETFTLIPMGDEGMFQIKCSKKLFLCADGGGGGNVNCNRKKAGDWETFRIANLDYIPQSAHPAHYGYAQPPPPQQYGGYAQPPPPQQYGGYAQPAPPHQQQYGYAQPPPPQQYGGYAQQSLPPPHHQPTPSAPSPVLPPKPKKSSQKSSEPRKTQVSSDLLPPEGDQDIIQIDESQSADVQAAHRHIGEFCMLVKRLDGVIATKINSVGQEKTFRSSFSKLASKKLGRGSSSVTLTREEKNSIVATTREVLDNFKMFLFDWNRYSRNLSERDFSRIALLLGDFSDRIKEASSAFSKSDTVKEALNKLMAKFEVIDIKFEQTISYSNVGNTSANFSQNSTIVDHSETYLEVQHGEEEEGYYEEEEGYDEEY